MLSWGAFQPPAEIFVIIAAIDPGESTGLVVYDSHRKQVIHAMTVPIPDVYTNLLRIEPETVIIEDQPKYSDLDEEIFHYFMLIQRVFPCVVINPGTWKPLAKAQKWKSDGDKHTQDAYNLLRYWKLTVGMEDIGDGTFEQ